MVRSHAFGTAGVASAADPTQSGVFLVDRDSTTYNAPRSQPIASTFFSIDTAVPIPGVGFGFFTPSQGFRSDGTPLPFDTTPAFDVSVGSDSEPAVNWGGRDLFEQVIANVVPTSTPSSASTSRANTCAFFAGVGRPRWPTRKPSTSAATAAAKATKPSRSKAQSGDLRSSAKASPQRVVYLSQVVDLGQVVNFGRLHWAGTPLRLVDGAVVEDPDAPSGSKLGSASVATTARRPTTNTPISAARKSLTRALRVAHRPTQSRPTARDSRLHRLRFRQLVLLVGAFYRIGPTHPAQKRIASTGGSVHRKPRLRRLDAD